MPDVAILAVPRLFPLDVTLPLHVLGRHPGYRVVVCGDDERSAADAVVRPTHPLAEAGRADVVVVPGYDDHHLPIPGPHLDVLRDAAARGARIVAVCTGVFALADAGLLAGRTATTHWRHADQLRRLGVDVLDNRLLVEDGRILTSAGASAGVEACLHLVRTDFGVAAADAVAKEVVSPFRDAGEPQYSDVVTATRAGLRSTRRWVLDHLGEAITVQRMADQAVLSRRTFIRRFEQESGMPPMRWVVLQRVLAARRSLESSDHTIDRIAAETGFGTAANLRSLFHREVGVTPSAYRRGMSGAVPS